MFYMSLRKGHSLEDDMAGCGYIWVALFDTKELILTSAFWLRS